MKRAIALVVVLAASGCGQNGIKLPDMRHIGHSSSESCDQCGGVEQFEGVVALFDEPMRAKREVVLDEQGNYVKHGRAVAYYENGQKAGEMNFVHDKPHGNTLTWFESGKKKMKGQSTDGVATGVWTEWYENGQMESQGEYVEGERHGQWKFWKPDGEMLETVEYRGGRKIGVVENPSTSVTR
ncbi:MAG TPA: toxin-antitoxin system YwqK family antitoxin [Pirellulales bacterium]|nr:toxin-antitoxin system YwqK family antitoxin [Pirellulales bacterium]